MTGYHSVKVFPRTFGSTEHALPEGWKPFAVLGQGGELFIVARKWHPTPKTKTLPQVVKGE